MRTTKGPWRVVDKRDKDYAGAVIVDNKGSMLADCNILGFGKKPITEEECLANAHLMAAAPELLEACQVAAAEAKKFSEDDLLRRLTAAITKAIK